MAKSHLPLNALRAFEASARHLSFTKAGLELRVTQAAVSHLVKSLEATLGVPLFRRVPRGLALTDEGQALLPAVSEAFGQLRSAVDAFAKGRAREIVTVGVVGTFAAGWLLPRLQEFHKNHPHIDLRILTNNNRVDIAGEGLDFAIRFGDGLWHGTQATHLLSAPLSPLCSPKIGKRLRKPDALAKQVLLRSYRDEEWQRWFAAVHTPCPPIRGPIFDSSVVMAYAAARGDGIALLPVRMFAQELREKRLMQPFRTEIPAGDYWLTALKSKRETSGMHAFKAWLLKACTAK
ncbi:MAG: LysR family transcriptional regulator [Xanthobacteraceae bacterium]|nr:LysR family transcriptional regulator [Xanthobacteraceae bacterium]